MVFRPLALLGLLALVACAPQSAGRGIPATIGAPGTAQITVPSGTVSPTNGTAGISVSGRTQPASIRQGAPDAATADAFAVNFLNGIQAQSFAGRREYCGYFFLTPQGAIAATPPVPGTLASCTQPAPGPAVFASYHTHGAYDRGYDNEVPSPQDLLGDFFFGIDGYISTPGGRIWRVEPDVQAALLVCGPGCVAVDPGFVPEDEAGILTRYTVAQLRAR